MEDAPPPKVSMTAGSAYAKIGKPKLIASTSGQNLVFAHRKPNLVGSFNRLRNLPSGYCFAGGESGDASRGQLRHSFPAPADCTREKGDNVFDALVWNKPPHIVVRVVSATAADMFALPKTIRTPPWAGTDRNFPRPRIDVKCAASSTIRSPLRPSLALKLPNSPSYFPNCDAEANCS